jgi:hypothetical protein
MPIARCWSPDPERDVRRTVSSEGTIRKAVDVMAFILAAVLVLAPFAVLYLVGDAPEWATRKARSLAEAPPLAAPVIALTTEETARCEAEGLLARRLVAGEIDRTAYHDAMAELAASDARSRPLHVPGDSSG